MNIIDSLSATPHPLGSEVLLEWHLNKETSLGEHKLLLFRSGIQFRVDDLKEYLIGFDIKTLPQSITGIKLEKSTYRFQDASVIDGNTYFYLLVIINETSDIIDSKLKKVEVPEFYSNINAIPLKLRVIEIIEYILGIIYKDKQSELKVFKEFPSEINETDFIIVKRVTSETAYKFFENSLYDGVKGDMDSDVIQVSWYCLNNPNKRDKYVDLFRGVKSVLIKHLFHQPGVIDVQASMLGDQHEKIENGVFAIGGMLIRCVIETQLLLKPEVLENLNVILNYKSKDRVSNG